MEPQTYSVLHALSSAEAVNLLVTLLEEPATVEAVAREVGISSATASRRLEGLTLVGLVTRAGPRAPYEVTAPVETRLVLESLGRLSSSILQRRAEAEAAFQRRLRKTRLRVQSEGKDGRS